MEETVQPQQSTPQHITEPPVLSKHFHLPRVFLIVVVAILAGGVFCTIGYFLGQTNQLMIDVQKQSTTVVPPSNSPVLSPSITTSSAGAKDQTVNWQLINKSNCSISFKIPQGWSTQINKLNTIDEENYEMNCIDIHSPDYVPHYESNDGLSLSITRTKLGTVFNGVTINDIESFESAAAAVLQPPKPVENIKSKTYGSLQGTYFESFGFSTFSNIAIQKNNDIYDFWWPKSQTANYQNQIDSIISTLKFTSQVKASLVPADSQTPAAGACIPVDSNVVTITLPSDNVPGPRCAKVTAQQSLIIVNKSNTTISGTLGQYSINVLPGQQQAITASFGSYLAPGVHRIPSGAEIWLQ